ncbi:hypothetical protein [Heyndrickxia shackletonii]|nr:hypothetical protein [Heyndrickxia shackletonii]
MEMTSGFPQSIMLNGISAHGIITKQLLEEKEIYLLIGRIPRLH